MSKARDTADIGDGSGLTGIVIPPIHSPAVPTGTTPSLDVGTYNFFNHGTLTGDTTISFASVPTNARWNYKFSLINLTDQWDVTTAVYSQAFSVSGQDTAPTGLFFKPDGLKMYVVGSTGVDINEYNLSTAWNISTASYLQLFSVAAQETSLHGLFFKPDGTKMYITGRNSDAVNEYNLSTAWDVTTAVYLQAFSVAVQEINPTIIFFKPDGLKMYILGLSGQDVNEYNLSTAWDVSTASYLQLFLTAAQENSPYGLFFRADGLKMYMSGNTNEVNEYDLSTAWDVTSLQLVSTVATLAQGTSTRAVWFKEDGLKMYVSVASTDVVNEYNIGTAPSLTLPASLQNAPTLALATEQDVLYEFVTDDAGVTVTLISEEIIND